MAEGVGIVGCGDDRLRDINWITVGHESNGNPPAGSRAHVGSTYPEIKRNLCGSGADVVPGARIRFPQTIRPATILRTLLFPLDDAGPPLHFLKSMAFSFASFHRQIIKLHRKSLAREVFHRFGGAIQHGPFAQVRYDGKANISESAHGLKIFGHY